ncbi:MAG: MBL fold metallo-hydrolase, partial [Acetanaerobacterium sp.]
MAMVCPLYSGSSGNATFVGNSDGGILVDAGVSCKAIKTALESIGQSAGQIRAIFVTHEHIDHIRGLKVLLKNFHIPLF